MAFAPPPHATTFTHGHRTPSPLTPLRKRPTMRNRVRAHQPRATPTASAPDNAKPRAASRPAPRFCQRCAAAMEERTPPGDERVRSVCPDCNLVAYDNPKLVVGCVPVSQDGKRVLLAKRAIPPVGKWTVPAGFLEIGENAEEGAVREAWEETRARLDISPTTLLAVYNILPAQQVQLLYRGVVLNEDSVAPGIESQDVRMFAWKDIPWNDLAFPTVQWALEYSYEHRHATVLRPQLKNR